MTSIKPYLRTVGILVTISLLISCGQQDNGLEKAQIHAKSAAAYQQQGQYRAAIIEARNAVKFYPSAEHQLVYAKIMLEIGRTKSIIKQLENVAEQQPNVVGLTLAKAYVKQGKFRSALSLLETLSPPESTTELQEYTLIKAQSLNGSKQAGEAEELLQALLQPGTDNLEAVLLQYQIALENGNAGVAEAMVEKLKTDFSESSRALFALSQLAANSNQLDETETLLTEALRLLPSSDIITPQKMMILDQLSQNLTNQGRFRDALIYKKLMENENPGSQAAQQRFNDAMSEVKLGNLAEAETLLAQLTSEFPGHEASQTLLGLVNLQMGDPESANKIFQKVIDPETASPQLVSAAAQAKLLQDKPLEAFTLLEKALLDNPNSAQLLAIYGLTALKIEGKESIGEIALQKAVATEPKNIRWRMALAQYYSQQQLPEQAIAQVKASLSIEPSNVKLQAFMSRILLSEDKTEEAIKFIHNLQNNYPKVMTSWLLSALVLETSGDKAAALVAVMQAQALDAEHPAVNLLSGKLQLANGQFKTAIIHFKTVLARENQNITAIKGLLEGYVSLDKADEGIAEIEALGTESNGNPHPYLVLAEYFFKQREISKAENNLEEAIKLNSDIGTYGNQISAQIHRALSRTALQENNLVLGRKHLTTALSNIPNSILLMADLAGLEIVEKKYTAAKKIIDDLDNGPAGKQYTMILRPELLREQGKSTEAIQLLESQWDETKNPQFGVALYRHSQLADLPLRKGLLDEWIETYPKDFRPFLYKGTDAQIARNDSLALSMYAKVIALQPEHAVSLNNSAWLLFTMGAFNEAQNFADRALKLAPENAAIVDTAGWIFFKTGDSRGLALLEKAAKLAPDNNEIQQHWLEARK